MAVGDTKSFHLLAATRTLLYMKGDPAEDNKNREPEGLTIVAPDDSPVVVTAEWEKFNPADTFMICDGREVAAADSQTAELTWAQFRDQDKLYVTVDVACDVHLKLEEPLDRPS